MSQSTKRFSLGKLLIGKPLATEALPHQAVSRPVGLAVFASDALSSTAYATEEILIILPDTALEVAAERAEFLRTAFSERPIEYGEQVMRSSISLGVAVFPLHGEDSKQLIQGADLALYAAKKDGRNRVSLAKHINKN